MVDTKEIEDLNQKLKETTDAVNTQYVSAFSTFFSAITAGAQSATKVMENLGNKIKDATASLTVMGASSSFKTLQDPLDKVLDSFTKMSTLVDQSRMFEQFSVSSGSAINTVTANLDVLQKAMTALHIPGAEAITGMAEGFVANAAEGEKLENSFIALSAAGGDMGKIFKDQGGELKDLTALTTAYSNTVADAADVTGLSVKQSMEFANALKEIPGAMDETIRSGDKAEDVTSSLIDTMKLMTGTGQSQATVINTLNKAYDDLSQAQGTVNNSAQKGSELLATISSVSTGLKLRFDDVKEIMEGIADQFRFVGNETDASARVLGRYTDALRETGLTGKASLEITKQMITNMQEMTVGTKAFLSLRTGGPGGLQGAFQIDQLLRQGRVDQVVQMAQKSLREQFGGKVYTQAEAAQSQEAAAGFMRQRQLLQSGAFGIGKGLGDEQATRLLEALGKGDTLAATKEIKTGQDALNAVTKQGTDIQARNNTELKTANRFLERNAIAAEITALASMRTLVGTTGAARTELQKQVTQARAAGEQQEMRRKDLERGTAPGDAQEQLIILQRQMLGNLFEGARGVGRGVPTAAQGSSDTAREAISGIHGLLREQTRPTPQQTAAGQTVFAHTVKTAPPAHPAPVVARNQQDTAIAAAAHLAPTHPGDKKQEPQTIKLEITHSKDISVNKKTDNNSINNFNAASAGITTTRIDWGY